MSGVTALLELPGKLVNALYGLTIAANNILKLLEGSGLSRVAVRAVSRRLRALTSTAAAALPGADAPDPHTASLPGVVYADYAGAPPYSISALQAATEDLLGPTFYGNPHSDVGWGVPSAASSAAADRLRQLTLALCRADPAHYVCVLTTGATAALKLVAEAFPWGPDSAFLHLEDNHNSVLGIREVAAARGAATGCVRASKVGLRAAAAPEDQAQAVASGNEPCHLFAYPLESNFSGVRYSEALTAAVQGGAVRLAPDAIAWHGAESPLPSDSLPTGRWRVLIDAAKAASTAPPDLTTCPADFVALSFYKIFGYPTGLGALIVRRDALAELRKTYFSGGTVEASLAEERFHSLRSGVAGLEDGTLPFLALPAALRGLEAWEARGGAAAAHAAGHAAAASLAGALLGLRHANGAPVCTVYGLWADMDRRKPEEMEIEDGGAAAAIGDAAIASAQGPTVTFNVLDSAGQWVGHRQVQRIASLEGVMLRSGAMCNPGACCAALGVGPTQARAWHAAGHVCWDDRDVMDGQPTGAVRASFGWGSAVQDAAAVAAAIARHFVDSSLLPPVFEASPSPQPPGSSITCPMKVHSVTVYPLKSAAGFSPRSWPVGPGGLLHDRRWAVVDAEGAVLTLRRCPALARVKPVVDLEARVLRLHAPGAASPLEIPLDSGALDAVSNINVGLESTDATICGKEVPVVAAAPRGSGATDNDAAATRWLHEALGLPSCRLVEHNGGAGSGFKQRKQSTVSAPDGAVAPRRSFANEAQLLVVTVESLRALQTESGVEGSLDAFAARFRPNLIIEDDDDYFEAASANGNDSDDDNDFEEGSNDDASNALGLDSLGGFEEESWRGLRVGEPGPESVELEAAGPCPRCEMVCLDPKTGQRAGPEPLLTLARARRAAGRRRLCFGVLMNLHGLGEGVEGGMQRRVAVGMPVTCST